MQIEYTITFRADGIVVSQNIEPGQRSKASPPLLNPLLAPAMLPAAPTLKFVPPHSPVAARMSTGLGGYGLVDKPGDGGGGPAQPLIVFSCPIVIAAAPPAA